MPDVYVGALGTLDFPGGATSVSLTTPFDLEPGYWIIGWGYQKTKFGTAPPHYVWSVPEWEFSFFSPLIGDQNATGGMVGVHNDGVIYFQVDRTVAAGATLSQTGSGPEAAQYTTFLVFKNLRTGGAATDFDNGNAFPVSASGGTGTAATLGSATISTELDAGVHGPVLVVGAVLATNLDFVIYDSGGAPNTGPFFVSPPPPPDAVSPPGLAPGPDFNVFETLSDQGWDSGAFSTSSFPFHGDAYHAWAVSRAWFWALMPGPAPYVLDPGISGLRATFGTLWPAWTSYEFDGYAEGHWGTTWFAFGVRREPGQQPCLVRDFTHQLRLFYVDGDDALICRQYDADDAQQAEVTVDAGPAALPAFYRREGMLAGTYLLDGAPTLALSFDHGNTWTMFTIPGAFEALTSQEHKGRLVVLGWRSDPESWYALVGEINRDGAGEVTVSWGAETLVVDGGASGQGHLREAADGDLNFAYQDTGGEWTILTCRALALDGSGTWF